MHHSFPLDVIQTLDPERDHSEICRLSMGYAFFWETTRALEYALLKTFCVPSIAGLLDQTQEFAKRPQKRYDDTGFIITKILQHGYKTPEGGAVLERMNRIHRRYSIANNDYLYVLSTFIYEPIRWNGRFGWRPFCDAEKLALYYFWQAVGDRMGIEQIPSTYEKFEQFNQTYEKQHLRYSAANQRVGDAVLEMVLGWFPNWMRSPVKSHVYACLDDPMLIALGWPRPTLRQRRRVIGLLKLRQRWVRLWPARKQDGFEPYYAQLRSYPSGVTLAQVGPPPLLNQLNQLNQASPREARCPFHRLMQVTPK